MKSGQDTVRRGTNPERSHVLRLPGLRSSGFVLPGFLLCALLFLLGTLPDFAQSGSTGRHPAPIERRPPSQGGPGHPQDGQRQQSSGYAQNQHAPRPTPARPQRETAGQHHLGEWLEQHQGLSLQQQQQALDKEPGFTKLQPQVQQRMNQRLQQLSTMTPARRDRAVERIEAMERLSPDQRQQVRGAMRQLGSLPPDRRRAVAKSFHALQGMPPQQQEQYLNSPEVRAQFSDQERATLGNLISVAPLLPNETGPARQR